MTAKGRCGVCKGALRFLKIRRLRSRISGSHISGFTLLEVLVAVSILGIAIAVVMQLFAADLRTLSASGDYVAAAAKAEAKMREVLDSEDVAERSLSEITRDGYRINVSVTKALEKRTENLPVALLDISLTVRWTRGAKEGAVTLRTMKMVAKQI